MRTIIDTSSLVRIAQSYNPFDKTNTLETFLNKEIQNGALIILDRVVDETRNVSQGIAYRTFKCIQKNGSIRSTKELIPDKRFFNMLDNNFVDRATKRLKLNDNDALYQNERDHYLKSADCAMIVYAMQQKNMLEPIQILTEESFSQNDGKLFKKIPAICQALDIPTINTVEYFEQHQEDLLIEVRATK